MLSPIRKSERDRKCLAPRAGFTLIELLTVVAIICLLMVVAVPMMGSISKSRNVTNSIYGIQDVLEYARSEAMARNTYTWVGFSNLPSGSAGNSTPNSQVAVASFCSQDGTATAGTNLISQLSKVTRYDNVKIIASTAVSAKVRDLLDSNSGASLATQSGRKELPTVGGVKFDYSVTFTPQGLAMLKGAPTLSDGFDEAMDIGVTQMAGNTQLPDPDDACLRVFGGSGTVHIYRLQ